MFTNTYKKMCSGISADISLEMPTLGQGLTCLTRTTGVIYKSSCKETAAPSGERKNGSEKDA